MAILITWPFFLAFFVLFAYLYAYVPFGVLSLSKRLLECGYFIPALRPPTVKEPRLRISLRADIETCKLAKLKEILNEI